MMGPVERHDVTFPSGTDRCAAWVYRPSSSADDPVPLVVLGHGLGAVREMRLDAYAERFAAAGLACLVFDYRHFGASGGEPRQLLDIGRQLDDWAAAIAFARTLDGVDPERVGLFGSSFGGGHVLEAAARDPRVAAVVAQCPFTDGVASALRSDWRSSMPIVRLALADLRAARRGGPPVRVPVVGPPGSVALMTAPDADAGYRALCPEGFDDTVSARIACSVLAYRPGRAVARVGCPILFSVCDHDSVAPARATRRWASRGRHVEICGYPIGHFDIYVGDDFELAVADQTEFLVRVLHADRPR